MKVQRRKSLRNGASGRKREIMGLKEDEVLKNGKKGKISPFISLRIIKSRQLDHVQWKSMAGVSEARSRVEIEDLLKNLNPQLQSGQNKTSCTLMIRGCATRALKALCSNRCATSRGTTCLREMK